MESVFPSKCYVSWGPACQKQLDICPLMESSEWIPYFALLAHTAFAFLFKLSLTWLTCPFVFLFSPHSSRDRGEKEAGWVPGCCPGSTHHKGKCSLKIPSPRTFVFSLQAFPPTLLISSFERFAGARKVDKIAFQSSPVFSFFRSFRGQNKTKLQQTKRQNTSWTEQEVITKRILDNSQEKQAKSIDNRHSKSQEHSRAASQKEQMLWKH